MEDSINRAESNDALLNNNILKMLASQQGVMFSLVVVVVLLSSTAHGRGAGAARQHYYHVVQTSHLEPKTLCSGLKEVPSGTGTWVPVHRPFGPCSPSSARPAPSLAEMLRWDQVRTEYVRRKATGMADDVLNPAKPHVLMSQMDFSPYAPFGIGSGSSAATIDADGDSDSMVLSQSMAIDTTVDVAWIQCAPCPVPQCYPQRNSLYDPSRSSTAAAVRCGSRACLSLGPYANGCSSRRNNGGGDCQYLVEYSDDRATAGTYMTDTLTISSSTAVTNFRFGCSHAVRGRFSDLTAGTMSLAGGAQSLLSQTARALGNAFSYCVPPASSSGFLSLGGPVATRTTRSTRSRFRTTPLVRNPINPSLHLVRLQGIAVAGRRLRIPPVVFSAGAVMDSSAVVTQLPPTAYRALRRAFRTAMAAYPRTGGGATAGNILDTCYDFLGLNNVTVPAVSLVFGGGAAVALDPPAVMLGGCLAFAPTATDLALGFIGNVQTQTQEVLYDVAAGTVGFRRGAC